MLPSGTGPRGGISGPEPPQELPRGWAVGVQMTAHSFIGTRNANNHFWNCSPTGADELRSKGHRSAVGRGVDRCFPDDRTGLCTQGHQVPVEPRIENHPHAVRYSAVVV